MRTLAVSKWRRSALKMTAKPPTTAKSTRLVARAANSFSKREIVSLGSGEGSMRMLLEKSSQVFQMSETAKRCRRTPDDLANRLLHWFNAAFH
jgi:hypothetical protein